MRNRIFTASVVLLGAAAIAWAASSTNFINDPAVFDQGGGLANSTNFDTHGSIGGVAMSADFGGGNQSGTASSANFINTIGFPDSAAPGGSTVTPPAFVTDGPANPTPSTELDSTTATIAMQQFSVTAGSGNVFITSFILTGSGSGDELNDVSGVDLYLDANGNGMVDGGETTVDTQQTFTVDNGTVTFNPSAAIQVSGGTTEHFLATYTFAGSASATDTFTCSVAAGGLVMEDGAAQPLTPGGLPRFGGTKTMVAAATGGDLSVTVGADNPGGTPVPGGAASRVSWFQLAVRASTVEAATLNGLVFTASGSMHDVLDVNLVRLYDDNGVQPGVWDSGDTQLATATYSGDDGTVTFTGLNFNIAANTTTHFLLAYDLAGTAPAGATGSATLAAPVDVTATGASSAVSPLPVNGTPVGSLRYVAVVGPGTISTPGSSGGGGCAMVPPGTVLPPAAPFGVILPWLVAMLGLLGWRRRDLLAWRRRTL